MLGYTLAQFHRYLSLALKRERRALRERMEATALGLNGGEALQAALKALRD